MHLYFGFLPISSDFAISYEILIEKTRAYPMGFSSKPDSTPPEVPSYAYHCYKKVRGIMWGLIKNTTET